MCVWLFLLDSMKSFVFLFLSKVMQPLYKRFGGKILNPWWLNRKPVGGNVPHVTCVKRSAVSSPPTGPAKSQQDNSQLLSSEIVAMSVCLTSTLTSPLWLLIFSPLPTTLPPPLWSRFGKLDTADVPLFLPGRHSNSKTLGNPEWNSCVSSITGWQRRDCCGLGVARGRGRRGARRKCAWLGLRLRGASCGLDRRTLNWNLDVYTAPLEEARIQVQSRKKMGGRRREYCYF